MFDSLPQREAPYLETAEDKAEREGQPSILGQTQEIDSGYWKKIWVILRVERVSCSCRTRLKEIERQLQKIHVARAKKEESPRMNTFSVFILSLKSFNLRFKNSQNPSEIHTHTHSRENGLPSWVYPHSTIIWNLLFNEHEIP